MTKLNLTAIIVAVVVIVGVLAGVFLLLSKGNETTVSANGNFQMKVAPDEAVVYLLVQTKGATAEAAKNENARISDSVLTSLIKTGIERKDIQTENFNIYPEYDWSNGTQTLIDYAASNNLKVTTTDFNNVGKIVDASVDSGALVSYINFELSNAKNNEFKAVALANASLDGKRKAEAIAAGLGKKIGDLVSVQSSDYNYAPYPLYRSDMVAEGVAVKSVSTNIQPTTLDITATVSVTYKLK